MKIKKNVMRVLISILAIVIAIGTKTSFAMQDYTENDAKTLALSYFRYANGVPVNGYAVFPIVVQSVNSLKSISFASS